MTTIGVPKRVWEVEREPDLEPQPQVDIPKLDPVELPKPKEKVKVGTP